MKNFQGLQALVVDDDRVVRTIIKMNLESIGIIPHMAANGVEAIEALRNHDLDFILMDIRMPDQDGLDATRWIRDIEQDEPMKQIPIFALTSYDSADHTSEILQAGMDEHLVKPFRLENLVKVLVKYFPVEKPVQ